MGASGCGKTTLLNCMSGLDTIDAGVVSIAGTDLATLNDKKKTTYRAQNMGFIFQTYNLLPVLSAVENVELPLVVSGTNAGEARKRALAALERVGLADKANAAAGAALRRPAPARHDRAVAGQRPGHRLGRRAHGRARLPDGERHRHADGDTEPRPRTRPSSSSPTTRRSASAATASCA